MKKIIVVLFLIGIFTFLFQSQGISQIIKGKPIRVGIKVGVPNGAGMNFEYSIWGTRFAPTADISYFDLNISGTDVKYTYFEIGTNVYLISKKGKGPYGHVSYGNASFEGVYTDASLGKGKGTKNLSFANFKVGAKLGGLIYFRPEIGFAAISGGKNIDVTYTQASTGEQVTRAEKIPDEIVSGFIYNIGVGISF